MLHYANLSDVDFEELAKDIFEKILNVKLYTFSKGRDEGIDVTDSVSQPKYLIQVKHYNKSKFSDLKCSLQREVDKIKKLNPKHYYIFTSCSLTPKNLNEIYSLFSEYMTSPNKNIFHLNQIESFLTKKENEAILEKYHKLWLYSSFFLERIKSGDISIDSDYLLNKIREHQNLYVATNVFENARDILLKNRVLLLIGQPGTGKTFTSEMLISILLQKGYSIRYTTDGGNIASLKQALSIDNNKKEAILLDDCLGQCYLKMKDTQSNELLSLVAYVRNNKNKILLLNSRITILNEAKKKSQELTDELDCHKVKILDITNISEIEKAKILYNHLHFKRIPQEYLLAVKENRNYLKIIKHKNYIPRVIEFITKENVFERITTQEYIKFIIQQLNNPEKVWEDEFTNRLDLYDRILLTTLYSLTNTQVPVDFLKRCYNYRISQSCFCSDTTINYFSNSLSRLNGSLIGLYLDDKNKTQVIGVINPSVNDFLMRYIESNSLEKNELKSYAISVPQIKKMNDKNVAMSIIEEFATKAKILELEFETEFERTDFIIYCIVVWNIKREEYIEIVQSFIKTPHDIFVYDFFEPKHSIVCRLLNKNLFKYYNLEIFFKEEQSEVLNNIMKGNNLEGLVKILDVLDNILLIKDRTSHIDLAFKYLSNVVDDFYCDMDLFDDLAGQVIDDIVKQNGDILTGIVHNVKYDLEEAVSQRIDVLAQDILMRLPQDILDFFKEKYVYEDVVYEGEASDFVDDYFSDHNYYGDDDRYNNSPSDEVDDLIIQIFER